MKRTRTDPKKRIIVDEDQIGIDESLTVCLQSLPVTRDDADSNYIDDYDDGIVDNPSDENLADHHPSMATFKSLLSRWSLMAVSPKKITFSSKEPSSMRQAKAALSV
ncbi:hypothetical protein NDU88_006712 [Pleurodeles waltl]|uniref:Uncharacterized protein n=1 Tax=Pleurodeles waltl TaxID=8319 RepID=A0AAV7UNK2_PLEWA|nr:hypothetical protein NDU88_006712 [Pleurodeles waltl]